MDQPVDQRGGDDDVASEDVTPGTEGAVGGDDDAPTFVAQITSPNKIRYWMTLTYNASVSQSRITPSTTNP